MLDITLYVKKNMCNQKGVFNKSFCVFYKSFLFGWLVFFKDNSILS